MIHPASYETCRESVDRAFELFPQKIAGKKVVIKPNVLRASGAEEHIVTNPALLRAVVEKIETLSPAQLIVGDNPGLFNYGDNENGFEKTGLMAAAKGYYRNLGNTTQNLAFHPDFMSEVGVSKEILDADILISLPKFKPHGLTVMTGAIKNSYGILPGAQKARLHQIAGSPLRFHELIVEVFRLRVPDLFIMDAVTGMEGNGPASPELRHMPERASAAWTRIASTVDGFSSSWWAMMACTILGDSPYLRASSAPITAWEPSTSWSTALPRSCSRPARLACLTLMPSSAAMMPHRKATSSECWYTFWV